MEGSGSVPGTAVTRAVERSGGRMGWGVAGLSPTLGDWLQSAAWEPRQVGSVVFEVKM